MLKITKLITGGEKMEEGIEQLVDMVANLKIVMEDNFKKVDRRFDAIDRRFEDIEEKLAEHDKRFDAMDRRFEDIEKKLVEHDKYYNRIEEKFVNTIRVIGHDVQNNKRHIDQLENDDDYYKISE